jgi:hypothetical protein
MGLDTQQRQAVTYFTGYEVEHTPTYGLFTLFVVDTPTVEEILSIAQQQAGVEQIYFGTSQSFKPTSDEDWQRWGDRIEACLDRGYWVTLDFDVQYAEEVYKQKWQNYQKFIPMISVKLPNVRFYNYNTTLKIDDTTWGATNPGVWAYRLNQLLDQESFTYWHEYTQDTKIK